MYSIMVVKFNFLKVKPRKDVLRSPAPTKKEIIDFVQHDSAIVVWITEKGSIVRIPTQPMMMIGTTDRSFFDAPELQHPTMPTFIVDGFAGLAATDPTWDGSPIFVCDNPECPCYGQPQDMDGHVHDAIWGRLEKKSHGGKKT
jgi:hypothetical protein